MTNSQKSAFIPAKYMPGKDAHIRYYVQHPESGELQRKKIRLNRIPEDTREKYAEAFLLELNNKLSRGWHPDRPEYRAGTTLKTAIDIYIKSKSKELRDKSIKTYQSTLSKFVEVLDKRKMHDLRCNELSVEICREYIEHLFIDHKARTVNNHILTIGIFCNWMKDYGLIKINPFNFIKKKRTNEKTRQIIDVETRTRIAKHLRQNDEAFLMVCSLVFHCLLRPNEITHLKPGNFNCKGNLIFIPGEASKNGTSERVTIPDCLVSHLEKFIVNSRARKEEYLFSQYPSLRPGLKRLDPRNFSRKWQKLRKALNLPEELQLYSLKDSGIIQLLEDGVPPNEVMKQARHSDLEITSVYLKHTSFGASETIRTRPSDFC